MSDEIYKGPNFEPEPPAQVPGDYTAADQAEGFGVPAKELVSEKVPPVGLSKKEWNKIRSESIPS